MATITINGVTLDPSAQKAALRSAKLVSADAQDSDYVLVQTKGPLNKEQRAALEKTGAKILEFVPQDTYVCHYPGTNLKKIRALPFVTWVNTYLRGFKINPALIPAPRSWRRGAGSSRLTLRFGNAGSQAASRGHCSAPRREGGIGARQDRRRGRSGCRRHQRHGRQGPADRSHAIPAQPG